MPGLSVADTATADPTAGTVLHMAGLAQLAGLFLNISQEETSSQLLSIEPQASKT